MSVGQAARCTTAHSCTSAARRSTATTSRCRADALHAAFGMSRIAHGRILARSFAGRRRCPASRRSRWRPMFRARTITAARCTMIRYSRRIWCSTPGSRCSPWRRARCARRARRRAGAPSRDTSRCRRYSTSARRWRRESYVLPSQTLRARRSAWRGLARRRASSARLRSSWAARITSIWKARSPSPCRRKTARMLVHSSTQHPTEVQQHRGARAGPAVESRHRCSAAAWAADSAARKLSRP